MKPFVPGFELGDSLGTKTVLNVDVLPDNFVPVAQTRVTVISLAQPTLKSYIEKRVTQRRWRGAGGGGGDEFDKMLMGEEMGEEADQGFSLAWCRYINLLMTSRSRPM